MWTASEKNIKDMITEGDPIGLKQFMIAKFQTHEDLNFQINKNKK